MVSVPYMNPKRIIWGDLRVPKHPKSEIVIDKDNLLFINKNVCRVNTGKLVPGTGRNRQFGVCFQE